MIYGVEMKKFYNINLEELLKLSIKGSQLHVLFEMLKTMNDKNISFITIQEIVENTGLTRKTVSKMIKYLTDENAIEINKNNKDNRKNIYKINTELVRL